MELLNLFRNIRHRCHDFLYRIYRIVNKNLRTIRDYGLAAHDWKLVYQAFIVNQL